MTVTYKLDGFEGPLDLLLHLISKHKLNINDIPILTLVEQYLDFIEGLGSQDMETAGEFLEMAARLIYIKTLSLLPRKEEAEELKKELQGRLIEYSLCKIAAANLKEIYIGDAFAVRRPLEVEIDFSYTLSHDPKELLAAYKGLGNRKNMREELKPSAFSKLVSKKFVTVTSKIVYVLKKLYAEGKCSMEGLFGEIKDRSDRVAAFLAVLELTKSGRVMLSDDNSELSLNRADGNMLDEELFEGSDYDG
ncbi:MAG: segregation/condensation protein A [Ruminococcus sp.]|nr:segregation/condensation protein A [Ruminococcus sp.]